MLKAPEVLDTYFLDTRCMILEIAATLDRYERGGGSLAEDADPRLARLREALRILSEPSTRPDRAERLLLLFSDDPDAGRPEQRGGGEPARS